MFARSALLTPCPGFDVIATVLPHESTEHLTQPHCHVQAVDVTDDESVETLLAFTEHLTRGCLDVLANNAYDLRLLSILSEGMLIY